MNLHPIYPHGYVSPWPVAVHIMQLQKFGYTYTQIARTAKVSERTIYMCASGQLRHMQAAVATLILNVTPSISDLDPGTLISARGARRRIQALGCNGWSPGAIARHARMPHSVVRDAAHADRITVRTHHAIAAVFEELWDQHPDTTQPWAERTVRAVTAHAQTQGWVPALAWDDIDKDDDVPTPDFDGAVDMVAVQLVLEGNRVHLTQDERHIALRALHAEGHLDPELAARLSVSVQTILRDRKRLGLPSNLKRKDAA